MVNGARVEAVSHVERGLPRKRSEEHIQAWVLESNNLQLTEGC